MLTTHLYNQITGGGASQSTGFHAYDFVRTRVQLSDDTVINILLVIGGIFLRLFHYTAVLFLTLIAIEKQPGIPLLGSNQGEPQKPITSSIRSTLVHLRTQGGFFSLWRGFGVYILVFFTTWVWTVVSLQIVLVIFPPEFPLIIPDLIVTIITLFMTASAYLAWTYAMVSFPSPSLNRNAFRNATWKQTKRTLPALFLSSLSLQLILAVAITFVDIKNPPIGLFFTPVVYFLVSVPATIILVRTQVSGLPEETSTIVPCDRSFGQDLSATDGVFTVGMAVRSIDWPLLRRAYGGMLKCLGIATFFVCQYLFIVVVIVALAGERGDD